MQSFQVIGYSWTTCIHSFIEKQGATEGIGQLHLLRPAKVLETSECAMNILIQVADTFTYKKKKINSCFLIFCAQLVGLIIRKTNHAYFPD